jgi:hypothetical protein
LDIVSDPARRLARRLDGFHVVAWYIHILLVLALVVLVIQLISGRRPAL